MLRLTSPTSRPTDQRPETEAARRMKRQTAPKKAPTFRQRLHFSFFYCSLTTDSRASKRMSPCRATTSMAESWLTSPTNVDLERWLITIRSPQPIKSNIGIKGTDIERDATLNTSVSSGDNMKTGIFPYFLLHMNHFCWDFMKVKSILNLEPHWFIQHSPQYHSCN